jgi:hypothetical protein
MKKMFVAAGLVAASMSFAQSSNFELPSNAGLRLGILYPIDSNLRSNSNSYFGVGLDLPISFTLTREAEGFLSFDWIGSATSGGKGNIYPLFFNQRFYSKVQPGQPRNYFTVGGGFTVINVTTSKTVLAAKLGYGTELGQNLYGEANFIYSDAAGGVHATSLGFYLGYRF